MRRILVFLVSLVLLGCATTPQPVYQMEIPMYGDNITAYQKKINDDFTNGIKALVAKGEYKDLRETSNHAVQRGWEAFRAGRYAYSVRRFNEGWLLDDSNPGVYWGFGDYYGVTRKFEKSIAMLEKSLSLDPSNLAVWADLVKSHNSWAFEYGNSGDVARAKELLTISTEKAEEGLRRGEHGPLYHNYSIALFYLERYREAKVAAEKAVARGEKMEKGYIEDINAKIAGTR